MADPIVTPQELLGKLLAGQEIDVLREAAIGMLRELMEIEVQGMTGAALGARRHAVGDRRRERLRPAVDAIVTRVAPSFRCSASAQAGQEPSASRWLKTR